MTVLSKSDFEEVSARYPCKEILHPWSDSCTLGAAGIVLSSLKGGLKFFSIMYAAHLLFRLRAKKKVDYTKECKSFLKSLLFISLYSSSFVGLNCFFRHFLGKYNYHVVFFLIPILSGSFVWFESEGRRSLNATTFLTGALEGFYRGRLKGNDVGMATLRETLIFMLLNGSLMCALRRSQNHHESPWFFTPKKIITLEEFEERKLECSHEGGCMKNIQKDLLKFGGIALLISTLKMIAMSYKRPSRIASQFFKWSNWRLPTFVAAYIGIFKTGSCYLWKKRGGDSQTNTFIAGSLAGLSYCLSPSLTILASLLTALLKVLGVQLKEELNLPELPYLEVTFILSNWYMLYLRAFDRKNCPKYLYNMLNMITLNKFTQRRFASIWKADHTQVLKDTISTYLDNPENVTPVWRHFLEWNPDLLPEPQRTAVTLKLKRQASEYKEFRKYQLSEIFIFDQIQMYRVMNNYHFFGHLSACLDPLGVRRPRYSPGSWNCAYRDLDSFSEIPLNKARKIILPDDSFIGGNTNVLPLKEIMVRFNSAYCQHVGIEFMNNHSLEIRQWIKRRFEEPAIMKSMFSPEIKQTILQRLMRARCFEEFVERKWPTEKRHSALGVEILIPALQTLVDFASSHGAQSFVLGMNTTRARLNILANVFRKPLQQIFVPFQQEDGDEEHHDVHELHHEDRYYLGNNVKKVTTNQALPTEFSVLASTSHFVEGVDPVVSGKTKSEQLYTNDEDGKRVWPIIIHCDEVLDGQGVSFENFRNSTHDNHSCQGTVHIVLTSFNNLRNEPAADLYCTNVAHTTMTPVIHVNASDPEAVIYCMSLAVQYRAKFKSDVVVDLICYPKHLDPKALVTTDIQDMIRNQPSTSEVYAEKLVHEGKKLQFLEPNTSVIPSVYKMTLENLMKYKPDINIHPTVINAIGRNLKLAKENKINWVMAELIAIATMLQEGYNIRLTGETAEEGKFIRRHHVFYAVNSHNTRIPLRGIYKAQGYYTVANSLACQSANLGFEIGFSQSSPKSLVIWESAGEDQTASAQYLIDVFIAAGESRWFRQSGIVCLIPHGMEGAGEGASTGRPERFLQMCNDDYRNPITSMPHQLVACNWIIANVTTPSNYFHILRRQIKVNFRKPLILFTHKSLYKNSEIYSHREDLLYKKKFQVYYPDPDFDWKGKVRKEEAVKVLLCTGRVYYTLLEARKSFEDLHRKVALCRLEQISPFPYEKLTEDLKGYKNASFHWVQEEHRNQANDVPDIKIPS